MEKFEILGSAEELAKSLEADAAAPALETSSSPESTFNPSEVEPPQESQSVDAAVDQQVQQPQVDAPEGVQYTEADMESAVISYLSERLGRQLSSFDDLNTTQTQAIDERVAAIARFVQDTGRAPEDWFRYQALNPSEMDDMTAVRIQMASEYPNLAYDEIELLINSTYKLNPDMYDESEVKLSQLKLKIDAQKAKQSIESLRSSYAAPAKEAGSEYQSFIDDSWVSEMRSNVDTLEGVEFDLGNGNAFTFGIDDQYKSQLIQKNSQLDSFFDSYIKRDGTWDYDLLSSHMTVIDNIDNIVKSVYQKGLGDGQKGLVNRAANVSASTPQTPNANQVDPVVEQLKSILGASNTLTFKI